MMNVALNERNLYEDVDLKSDILYFKLGVHGLVSLHGKNYNIKKRMNAEQLDQISKERSFYPISSNCYINIDKIKCINSGKIYFGSELSDAKQINVNRRKQYVIEQLFSQRVSSKESTLSQ